MKINTMLFTAVVSVLAGMALYTPASMIGGCAHPGQSTLRAGQCLLDNGVLAEVLAALGKPDYLEQVENVALARAGDLVDCALQAVVTGPSPGPAGSAPSALWAPPEADTLASRARQAIAARRAAGK